MIKESRGCVAVIINYMQIETKSVEFDLHKNFFFHVVIN